MQTSLVGATLSEGAAMCGKKKQSWNQSLKEALTQ